MALEGANRERACQKIATSMQPLLYVTRVPELKDELIKEIAKCALNALAVLEREFTLKPKSMRPARKKESE